MNNVVVIGAGAWGTAIAQLLADNNHAVTLWCHEQEVVETIQHTRENKRYLPGIALSPNIVATHDLHVIENATIIFEAVPVKHLRSILVQAKPHYKKDQTWVMLSKGIEQESLLLPTQIIDDVFQVIVHKAVFSGPSFAHDLVHKDFTGGIIASGHCEIAKTMQALLATSYFRADISKDVLGVQLGGALKNIVALGIGLLDGAGYGDNAKALFFTRGFSEMVQLAIAAGAQEKTLYGLSGLGDLMLTATGKHSRNVALGRRLGAGESLDAIIKDLGTAPESVNTLKSAHQLMHKHTLVLPVFQLLYEVVYEGMAIEAMMKKMMKGSI